jgi:hypothetical protein
VNDRVRGFDDQFGRFVEEETWRIMVMLQFQTLIIFPWMVVELGLENGSDFVVQDGWR